MHSYMCMHAILNVIPHFTLCVHVSISILQNRLSQKFKVTGIPTLVFVNAENGSVITTDGRSVVMEDPDGKEFPWTPKPVLELLSGNLLEKGGDTTWDVVQKSVDYVGVYFSAHWVCWHKQHYRHSVH